jgi:hypothetical protein
MMCCRGYLLMSASSFGKPTLFDRVLIIFSPARSRIHPKTVSNKGCHIVLYAKFRGYRAPLCAQQETLKRALKFGVRLRDAKSGDSLFVRYLH